MTKPDEWTSPLTKWFESLISDVELKEFMEGVEL